VSKKQKNFDTLLWLCKQFQECGVEEYLLAPDPARLKDAPPYKGIKYISGWAMKK
jgi:hypothetical protein